MHNGKILYHRLAMAIIMDYIVKTYYFLRINLCNKPIKNFKIDGVEINHPEFIYYLNMFYYCNDIHTVKTLKAHYLCGLEFNNLEFIDGKGRRVVIDLLSRTLFIDTLRFSIILGNISISDFN